MLKYFWLIVYMGFSIPLFAQTASLKGIISSGEKPVPYANVVLKGSRLGANAQANGSYLIKNIPKGKYKLSVSCLGYTTKEDSIQITEGETKILNITLKEEGTELREVVVTGTMKESYLHESPVKVEILTPKFFLTSPSNNIMEALHTINGVQEQVNCGVCGTNDIHINGMEGPYTLVLIDGMPIVSALSSVYGFNGIPTNLIKRVEIVKGPASSLYGSEAVGGVINIITQSPETAPKFSFNSYFTSHREWNTDIGTSFKVNKKANSLLSVNYYRNQYRLDDNKDNFTDIPLNNRLSVFNKWSISRRYNRQFTLAARYYTEDRFGGTLQWKREHRGDSIIYGESISTNRIELVSSYQLPISKHKFRLDISYNQHIQHSYYGKTLYDAKQQVFFGNLIYDTTIRKHSILFGATYRQQLYDDNTTATVKAENRIIPGIFVQDELKASERTTLLFGLRTDHHTEHGFVWAPRFAFKYLPTEWSTLRINAGKGFRLVNLFTEEHAALTGARTVVMQESLKPEQSYNININYNLTYAALGGSGNLDGDVFYTYFSNKIIPDYNSDPNLIIYANLGGHAEVRGFAVSNEHKFKFPLKIKTGFTYLDVFEVEANNSGEKRKIPQVFAPKFSGTFLVGYTFRRQKITIDYTGKVVGPQNLPIYDAPYTRDEKSTWFTLQNVQLTKEFKQGKYQLYTGVKNIFNFTQSSPLIAPESPFSDAFDTSYAWGPLQTRRLFVGVRINISQ